MTQRCDDLLPRGYPSGLINMGYCWSTFGWFWADVHGLVPEVPGVYIVFLDGALAYIGSAKNIAKRLATHNLRVPGYSAAMLTPWGRCSDAIVKIRVCFDRAQRLALELKLIRRLDPPFNVLGKKRSMAAGVAAVG